MPTKADTNHHNGDFRLSLSAILLVNFRCLP